MQKKDEFHLHHDHPATQFFTVTHANMHLIPKSWRNVIARADRFLVPKLTEILVPVA